MNLKKKDIFKEIECFAIVIEGDERSEYYYEYCKPGWEKVGITVKRFNAVTPKNLNDYNDYIEFEKHSRMSKYVFKSLKVEITPTEKACFISHFKLWEYAAYSRNPIMILEHDSYLESPENLWFDEKYRIIFYDKGSMGSYIITPSFAKDLINHIFTFKICSGPYGHIDYFAHKTQQSDKVINQKHKLFKPASNQVMSKKYGNTIEHFKSDKFKFKEHNFIIID